MGFNDMGKILKIQQAWGVISGNHPRLPQFISDVRYKGMTEGQEIAIAIRYPDGTEFKTGIRLQASDIDAINSVK